MGGGLPNWRAMLQAGQAGARPGRENVIISNIERTKVATKVNVVLDDDVKAELELLVESGQRSRVINRALRREMLVMRRERADKQLGELRRSTKPVSTSWIVDQIRRDRNR